MADPSSTLSQAQQLIGAGQIEPARQLLERALRKTPHHPDLNSAMCFVCARLGRPDDAALHAERALAARPKDAAFIANLANLLAMAGSMDRAAETFEKALAIDPSNIQGWNALAAALFRAGRLEHSLDASRRALARFPDHARLVEQHATTLRKLGRLRDAYDLCKDAARKHPQDLVLALECAFNSNYPSGVDPGEIFDAHAHLGRLIGAGQKPAAPRQLTAADADRPLRIGLLSPDFREHSCSYYALPLVEHLDRGSFQLSLYFTDPRADARTDLFRRLADCWCHAASMDDQTLAQRIALDRIDILIDLAGLTTGARHALLARKPAPVLVTYLGYPNTTGLAAVDWRIVDSITDPPGSADRRAAEKLYRLDPCFLCYRPSDEAPEVSALPCESAGAETPFTFGSFNAGMKLSDECIRLWAGALHAVQGSRLLLKNFDLLVPEVQALLRRRFEEAGIDPDRVITLGYTRTTREHLATYSKVDLGLDSFPYHGTTTTCEAFHQGVPVVTLAGEHHAARVGASLLGAVGLGDLVARSSEEFVSIAAALAQDRPRLRQIRATLRSTLAGSALGDGPAFAERFGRALRDIWRHAVRERQPTQ